MSASDPIQLDYRWPPRDPDIESVLAEIMSDGSWAQYDGRWNEQLVNQLCEEFDCRHALTCSSGTFAVELALRALEIKPGDEVILAGYDFPGNFRAIEAIGARPVLVDVIRDGWIIDIDQVAMATGERTRAVIASHLHGQVVDMDRLMSICEKLGLKVVEDACQCPGATLNGRPLGSFGHLGVLSFGGSKLLTAGRGGAILSDDERTIQRARLNCERGNNAFPLSEIQAAILGPQLDKLRMRNEIRLKNVNCLVQTLSNTEAFQFGAGNPSGSIPAFYKLPMFARLPSAVSRSQLINSAIANQIELGEGFRGFIRRSEKRCRRPADLPQANIAVDHTILLHHPILMCESDVVGRAAHLLSTILE